MYFTRISSPGKSRNFTRVKITTSFNCDDIDDVTFDVIFGHYVKLLVYGRNIFGSSGVVVGNLRVSSKIFGYVRKFWKMFGNIRVVFGTSLEYLQKIIKNAVISVSI